MHTAEYGNMNTTHFGDQALRADTMRLTVDFAFYVSLGMIGSALTAAGSQSFSESGAKLDSAFRQQSKCWNNCAKHSLEVTGTFMPTTRYQSRSGGTCDSISIT